MIRGLQMPKITYVHTTQRETISIREELEKPVMPEKMKLILKIRTQMVEEIYKYFDLDLSESHRDKLNICTLLDPRFKKFKVELGMS
jgi:hypothetical protein